MLMFYSILYNKKYILSNKNLNLDIFHHENVLVLFPYLKKKSIFIYNVYLIKSYINTI